MGEECLDGCLSLEIHPLEQKQFTSAIHRQRILIERGAAATVLQNAPPARRTPLVGGISSRNAREFRSFMVTAIVPLLSFDSLNFFDPILRQLIIDSIQSSVINDRSHPYSSLIHSCPPPSSQ
jgi:hypothetical protein